MALPTVAGTTSSIASYPSVYYDRKAVKALYSNLFLYDACEQKPMPNMNGVAMQIFGYTKLAANTTTATEGTPVAGAAALTASTGTISLSQYVDYISYSDKVVLTGISDVVAEGSELLGYRGALTVDTVISTAVDAAVTADSTTKIDVAHGSKCTVSTIRQAVAQLRSVDAKPKDNGDFYGVIHSLATFDMLNDNTAGGFIDMLKYTPNNAGKLQDGINPSSALVGRVFGCRLYESNAIPTQAAFVSTIIGYRTYIFAKDAFFAASLGNTKLGQKNFSVKTSTFSQGQNSLDPAALIKAASSYNFFFGVAKRPQGVNVFRRITAESSIG